MDIKRFRYVVVLLTAPVLLSAAAVPPVWEDQFASPDLDPAWYWVNENPAAWSLTENEGYLRIRTSAYATGGENLLLRNVGPGKFVIETRVLFEPTSDFQFAGLVVFQDGENLLQLGRASCDTPDVCVGNGIYFDRVQNGGFAGDNFATQTGPPLGEAYLRLERQGVKFTAFYSENGADWQLIGVHKVPGSFDIDGVGLTASQNYPAEALVADFDYFRLIGKPGPVPPAHPRPNQPVSKNDCKNGGWRSYPHAGFRNQGDCIRFVNTGVFVCRDALGCVSYPQGEPVPLASALAISGDNASLGLDSQRAVELALSLHGPLYGHPLQLRAEDDECSPEGGESAATLILGDPSIAAVVGTSCSSAARVAAPMLSGAGLSMVSPSNTNPLLTAPATHEPGYLRTAHNDADNAAFMAQFLREQGIETSAVIVEGTFEGAVPVGEAFAHAFEDLGGSNQAIYDASSSDLSLVLDGLADSPPGVLYFVVLDAGLGSDVVSGARSREGLNETVLATNDFVFSQQFIDDLGHQADGMLFGLVDDSYVSGEAYLGFAEAYLDMFSAEPSPFFGGHAFDATRMILRALENTAVVDGKGMLHVGRQALRTALFATKGLEGATGAITCNEFGDCGATEFRVFRVEPIMDLRVNYGHDWVESFFEAGHEVVITVTDGDGVEKATATVPTEPKDFWEGRPGFQTRPEDWSPAPPDLQPYDWVYAQVVNGVTAQVQLGDIQGAVDIGADSITGTIEASWLENPVPVECLDWGSGAGPFNRDAGTVLPNGGDESRYRCQWDPDSEWDIQPWQDVGVGYFTPEGHWVANAFRGEFWMATWTHDLPSGFWAEGEHSYYFDWAYTIPEGDDGSSETQTIKVWSSLDGVETPLYDGFVLIEPWDSAPQLAWTVSVCEAVAVVHPDQPTRFVWGWVNDFSMSYEEALAHFNSFTVEVFWDGDEPGSAQLTMGELLQFTDIGARWQYRCTLTQDE